MNNPKTYGDFKKKFQPSCTVGDCGVVKELMNKNQLNKQLIGEINELREDMEIMIEAAKEEGGNEYKVELMGKLKSALEEVKYFKDKEKKMHRQMLHEKFARQHAESRLEHEKKKTEEILSYAAADEKIQEKTEKLKKLTFELESKHRQLEMVEEQLQALKAKHDELLDATKAKEDYYFNKLQYAMGKLHKPPEQPREYERIKITDAPKARAKNWLQKVLRL